MMERMTIDRKREEQLKDRKKWEQAAVKRYARTITTADHVLETRRIIKVVYAEIEESLAHIKKTLNDDPKQGEQVIKVKKNFLSRADADTFSGHMKKVEGNLERKFVTDTEKLCSETARICIEFDRRMLGEFLKQHGVNARKLDYAARAVRYDEIIAEDPVQKPIFYNIRRNLLALVAKLGQAD
jgi:hypothetical protein